MIHWQTASHDEKITAISALTDAGKVFSEVAEALGVDKSQLHGFCFRNSDRVDRPAARKTEWHLLRTPEARMERMRKMDGEGRTPAQMGSELGVSAAAIVAFAHRNNFRIMNCGTKRAPVHKFKVMPDLPSETWVPVHDEPIGLLAVSQYTCRWPVGTCDGAQQMFCGGPVEGHHYCEHHLAMSRRPSSKSVGSGVHEKEMRRKPMASMVAMSMAGVAPRRMEVVE